MDKDMSRAIAHAANQMNEAASVEDTLAVIVRTAAETMPAFPYVGLSTLDKRGAVATRAATSDLVAQLDAVQHEMGQGPFVDSMAGADVVVAAHIQSDQRWSSYVPYASARGLRSQMSVRLHLDDAGIVGGLNFYSTTAGDIATDDVTAAAFFATHAALALGQARHLASLTKAVQSRQAVGQAIGILMERYSIDETAAHAFLWRASSHSNVKVRDVAAALVAEGNTNGGRTSYEG